MNVIFNPAAAAVIICLFLKVVFASLIVTEPENGFTTELLIKVVNPLPVSDTLIEAL